MIIKHDPKEVDLNCDNGATIDVGQYNLSTNKIGVVEVDLIFFDLNAPANIGSGKFQVYFHRYAGSAVVDRQAVLVSLSAPGTLTGSSVNTVASGNSVISRFTGVSGRTIRVIASFKLTTIQD